MNAIGNCGLISFRFGHSMDDCDTDSAIADDQINRDFIAFTAKGKNLRSCNPGEHSVTSLWRNNILTSYVMLVVLSNTVAPALYWKYFFLSGYQWCDTNVERAIYTAYCKAFGTVWAFKRLCFFQQPTTTYSRYDNETCRAFLHTIYVNLFM